MRKTFLIFLLLFIATYQPRAQSKAHEKSAFFIIDPAYSVNSPVPESCLKVDTVYWLYGPGELECWRLHLLRKQVEEAGLQVEYPGTYHQPFSAASFRLKTAPCILPEEIAFRAIGQGKVFINHEEIYQFKTGGSFNQLKIPANTLINEIRFEIATSGEPPALLVQNAFVTSEKNHWEWMDGNGDWHLASSFLQTKTGVPPHRLEYAGIKLKPENTDVRLYDFGRELYGYVVIQSEDKPEISVGESKDEALDTLNEVLEQPLEMVRYEKGYWRSGFPLAFRYVHINGDIKSVHCNALFHPLSYRGAFACSDTLLTRIWMHSAYTLRLCMHDFLIDGIKRDRLPWTGDLAMSMMANAYSFGDKEIVRRSLIALGYEGIKKTDINGIIDYSLWWIIAQDHYQLYFGDPAFLFSEWPRIREIFDHLFLRCDSSGFLKVEKTWLFIDWVDQEKWTALQILWWWAQECGVKLANRVGDTLTASYLQNKSVSLGNNLYQGSWNKIENTWFANPKVPDKVSKHANLLAIISGLTKEDKTKAIYRLLADEKNNPVGTPYMAGFENIALARLGDIQNMLTRVKNYWGGMLDLDATTFWEAYDSDHEGKEHYSFYGRPYGKSLCHAWSSGPAAFLPSEILGIRPLEDGWKRFSVHPNIGSLKWVSSTIPTAFGNIGIDIDDDKISLSIPAGMTAEWDGKSIVGPVIINKYKDE